MSSLRGVHWFNSDRSDLPREGWNVETVIGVATADGTTYNAGEVAAARYRCLGAQQYGLTNIVRLDWTAGGPTVPSENAGLFRWIGCMGQAILDLAPYASLFIVGNEPTIDGAIPPSVYAKAFNELYRHKPTGSDLLVAGPAPWSTAQNTDGSLLSDLGWLMEASRLIDVCAGFALHAYGTPGPVADGWAAACPDPSQPCTGSEDAVQGDWGFRRYRDQIAVLCPRWNGWPIYITEFNTFGFGADFARRSVMAPQAAYQTGFIPLAYEEVRSYNAEPDSRMPIRALCWFVDLGMGAWSDFALSGQDGNMPLARAEFITADTSTGIPEAPPVAPTSAQAE